MTLSPLGEAALGYAERGWRVIPLFEPLPSGGCACGNEKCAAIGKHPRIGNWQNDASSDPDQVRRWWSKWPPANVGGLTGDKFDVLDQDHQEAIQEVETLWWNHEHSDPKSLPSSYTGKGLHTFFAATGMGRHIGFRPGLDWMGRDGFIVLPPSRHRNGGLYEWRVGAAGALPAAPPWLRAMVEGRTKTGVGLADGPIPEGRRNDTLYRVGGYLRRQGFGRGAIEATLLTLARGFCAPPYRDEEWVIEAAKRLALLPAGPVGDGPFDEQDARTRLRGIV